MVEFRKYHALGNDYVVLAGGALGEPPDPAMVRRICDRHHGIGADGILLDVSSSRSGTDAAEAAAVRIFNPDGSEAEKSGNGIRIFARYLRDRGHVKGREWFGVETPGGAVACSVSGDGRRVAAEMGRAVFDAAEIPVRGERGEVLNRHLTTEDGRDVKYSAVSIGNPHCVVAVDGSREADARALGPLVEHHPAFPNRTNVQLVEVLGPHRIRIEIWERGAGYTLASGTSSCAAAAVCCRLGRARTPITVEMPGGEIEVDVREDWSLRMEGGVTAVAAGVLSPECLGPPPAAKTGSE